MSFGGTTAALLGWYAAPARPDSKNVFHRAAHPGPVKGKQAWILNGTPDPFRINFLPRLSMTRAQVLGGCLLLWIAGASERKHSVAKLYMIA